MPKVLNNDEKLESIFEHIGGLYEQLNAIKTQPNYTPFTEIPNDRPNPEKCLKEEILQFSQFATELNGKTGTYFLASQANKKLTF